MGIEVEFPLTTRICTTKLTGIGDIAVSESPFWSAAMSPMERPVALNTCSAARSADPVALRAHVTLSAAKSLPNRRSGLTLVALLVVIAIIGMLMGLAL